MIRRTIDADQGPITGSESTISPNLGETGARAIKPPQDVQAFMDFVPSRLNNHRRPPPIPLVLDANHWNKSATESHPPTDAPPKAFADPILGVLQAADFGVVADLQPEELAARIMDASVRLSAQPELAMLPKAAEGIQVLRLQALMFQHLHILRSSAMETST